MGLFSWMKKAKQKAENSAPKESNPAKQASNVFSGKVPPKQFYALCVKDYHDKAKSLGYAERDLIFIPELIGFGQKAVLWFLSNDELQKQFSSPEQYYFVAVSSAIRCGIIFALKWHHDFAGLNQPGYVESVMESGLVSLSEDTIENDLGMDKRAFHSFCMEIFDRWVEMHQPYWELQKPRDYTFSATLAAYQLGISMILCKYGF